MRPVRPDGVSRRTRENPCGARPDVAGYLLLESCASRRPGPRAHCGANVKTSSETEDAATRPPDPGEEIDPTEKHTLEALSDPDSGVLPSPCHVRDLPRSAGEGELQEPPASPRALDREERPTRRTTIASSLRSRMREPWRPYASVIAATPRAPRPIPHHPRRTRAVDPSSGRRREPPYGGAWLGIARILQ